MKKLILSTTFLIAGAVSLLSQGAVTFDLDPSLPWGDGVDRLIYETTIGVDPVKKDTWAAQLQENRGGNWVNIGPGVAFIGDYDGYRGFWFNDGEPRTISVPQGTATQLRIQVLDMANGNRELAASDPFSYTHRISSPPAAADTLMINFRAFAVPEPSTVALGVLGLGALLLFRRRR